MAGPDGQLLHVAWVSRRVCVCVCGGAGHATSSGRTGLGRSREAGARWPQLYCGGFDVNKESDFCRDVHNGQRARVRARLAWGKC